MVEVEDLAVEAEEEVDSKAMKEPLVAVEEVQEVDVVAGSLAVVLLRTVRLPRLQLILRLLVTEHSEAARRCR